IIPFPRERVKRMSRVEKCHADAEFAMQRRDEYEPGSSWYDLFTELAGAYLRSIEGGPEPSISDVLAGNVGRNIIPFPTPPKPKRVRRRATVASLAEA